MVVHQHIHIMDNHQNTDMMHTYYQQYNVNPTGSPKGLYSNGQQTYWSGTHEEAAAAAIWQQQHYQ